MKDEENIRTGFISALERLGVHDHLCLIYESPEEQLAAAIPFLRMGLERNEQCVYIVDENTAHTVLDVMRREGICVDHALASGALKVITKRESYLREGYFDPDSMIRMLKDTVNSAKKDGFEALRVTGEMTWALGREMGIERLIEYEAKLNYFFPENDALAICQYNLSRFQPDTIIDVIRTHPLVIFGSMVYENFYYVPPDEFLRPRDRQISMEVERLLRNMKERKRAEEEIRRLNSDLEKILIVRTAELEKVNAELERMNKLFVGRELKMIELKKTIGELEKKLGLCA